MPSMLSVAALWSSRTTSGEFPTYHTVNANVRLLDKIAKQIMVCENKTITRWEGSIGEYKNFLRKKMLKAGSV